MQVGLFGGTFNPIHNGHLAIARQAREALGLDQVLFIPTRDPPHKTQFDLAPAKDRYELVRLAITSDPTLAISDVELRRAGKSYSIDTVRVLQQEYGPQSRLFFLIGLDAFLDFSSWREPDTLLKLCTFVVISRPGTAFRSLAAMPLLAHIPKNSLVDLDVGRTSRLEVPIGAQQLICLRFPPSEISASEIRTKIKLGLPLPNQLPPLVESYIIHHHLYA